MKGRVFGLWGGSVEGEFGKQELLKQYIAQVRLVFLNVKFTTEMIRMADIIYLFGAI